MKRIVLMFVLFIIFASSSYAHPGRTDSNGGHYDRSTGEYHYHNGGSSISTNKEHNNTSLHNDTNTRENTLSNFNRDSNNSLNRNIAQKTSSKKSDNKTFWIVVIIIMLVIFLIINNPFKKDNSKN